MSHQPAPSLLVRALRGEPVERTPIWIMRQAGRYMPQYRAIRRELGFLELCKHPQRAAEVTMLPMEILDVDAAIVFSDILLPVEAMGCPVEFDDAGPTLPRPVRDRADLDRLVVFDPETDCPWACETIRLVVPQLGGLPCLGFAGAPFTLASYMVEGKTSRSFGRIKAMMYREPDLLHALLAKVTDAITGYLDAQVEAGAAAVQLFDTWAGALSPHDYETFALPYQKRVFGGMRHRVPTVLYVNGGGTLLRQMRDSGAGVISLDWRVRMGEARQVLGPDVPVQGNLEPATLYGPPERTAELAREILNEAGPRGHVFNLGHGILPDIPVDHARALVEEVKAFRHGA